MAHDENGDYINTDRVPPVEKKDWTIAKGDGITVNDTGNHKTGVVEDYKYEASKLSVYVRFNPNSAKWYTEEDIVDIEYT